MGWLKIGLAAFLIGVMFWLMVSNGTQSSASGGVPMYTARIPGNNTGESGYGVTTLVSIASDGSQSDSQSFFSDISDDGRWVVFETHATTLVAGDTNGFNDIFVHDRLTATTERISVPDAGGEGNADSFQPVISGNGAVVAFISLATNLVPDDTNNEEDVFIWERASGTVRRVTVSSSGAQGEGFAFETSLAINGDGRAVVFSTMLVGLVPNDTNSDHDVFVHDYVTGVTERVSISSGGEEANNGSYDLDVSDDGQMVVFDSNASNLVPNDTNVRTDVFVHDRDTAETIRVSVGNDGSQLQVDSDAPAISGDGRFVVFGSFGDPFSGSGTDIYTLYVHDRVKGTLAPAVLDGNGGRASAWKPGLSHDGRYLIFYSSNPLVAEDTNGNSDVFRRDMQLATYERISVGTYGSEGNRESINPRMAMNGQFISWSSDANTLVKGDTNNRIDVFVRAFSDTPPPTRTPTPTITPTATATPRVPPYANEIMLPLAMRESGGDVIRVRAVTRNGNNNSTVRQVLAGGNHVLFTSFASNLVPNDTNNSEDVFLWERATDHIQRLSLNEAGEEPNSATTFASMSRNGQWVLFSSYATNLMNGDTNLVPDMFLRHLPSGDVRRVSEGAGGTQANEGSTEGFVSDDGRYVTFSSMSTNLTELPTVPGTNNIFWRDLSTGETRMLTIGFDGAPAASTVMKVTDMTPDGRYVLVSSDAPNLIPDDTNGAQDVFRYDTVLQTVERVSLAYDGREVYAPSFDGELSADGRYVIFTSTAAALMATPDTNNIDDVFVRDMVARTTERVSLTYTGAQIEGHGSGGGDISDDGRYVIWDSGAGLITPEDNGYIDTFWRDRATGEVQLASMTESGGLATGDSNYPSLSPDGWYVIYSSNALNIVAGAGNMKGRQIYWWRR